MTLVLDEENIIKVLGIESLPDDRKVALIEKVSELVQKRLLLRLLDSLPEPEQENLKSILDRSDQSAIQSFLNEKAPKLADWAADEVLKVKAELQDHVTKQV